MFVSDTAIKINFCVTSMNNLDVRCNFTNTDSSVLIDKLMELTLNLTDIATNIRPP
jgi:hypothetical protein